MKKLMKLGSLLITLSLLLSTIPGMTVKAATTYYIYCSSGAIGYNSAEGKYEYTLCTDEGCTIPANITTLSGGDGIKTITGSKSVELRKDGLQKTIGTGLHDIPAGTYTYEISAPVNEQNRGLIELTTYNPPASAPVDPAPALGEPVLVDPAPAPEKEEDKHEHNWEWIQIQAATDAQDGVEAMCCTECGQQGESRTIVSSAYGVFCGETKDKITGAAENATVEMETEIWSALPKSVMDAIKERRDLTVNLTLTYQNKEYPLSIPAGYDMSVLEEADWYGVLYLNQFFGVANQ